MKNAPKASTTKKKVEESHVMIVTCGLIYYEPEEDIRIIQSFFTELVARSKPSKVFSTPRLMMRFLGDPNRPIKCIEPFLWWAINGAGYNYG